MRLSRILVCLLTITTSFGVYLLAADLPTPELRSAAAKNFKAGNFKEAYVDYKKLTLDPQNDPLKVGSDFNSAVNCLLRLARISEIDSLRDQFVAVHKKNWRAVQAAALNLLHGQHYGYIVAGEFTRGHRRGGGRYVNITERDRAQSLQLFVAGMPLVAEVKDQTQTSQYFFDFAQALLQGRSHRSAFLLQTLTDLNELPDFEDAYRYYGRGRSSGSRGAPVDADGNPVYYQLPDSYEAAETDGERWRWALAHAAVVSPTQKNRSLSTFANFLQSQFGVQSMQTYGVSVGRGAAGDDDTEAESGPYAVRTLKTNETIAQLATGIKRFNLPDEFNYIKIYEQLAASKTGGYQEHGLNSLTQIFQNRQQYPKAAELWSENIRRFGPGNNRHKEKALNQIVKNWGKFENVGVQPAGKGATVEYRFRNGNKADFVAHQLKVETLIQDVFAYLKSNPKRIDYNKFSLDNIGQRIVQLNEKKYLGEQVAKWSVELDPKANHFDSRTTIDTPLQKAGAYLLTSTMAGGNTTRTIMWVSDTVVAKKRLNGKQMFFVADAVTGKPIPNANLEFFGYQQKRVARNKYTINTSQFADSTNADGLAMPASNLQQQNFTWTTIVRTKSGRLAFLGFNRFWYGNQYNPEYNRNKVFAMTDRPVYRPDHAVKFKFWVRNVRYTHNDGKSHFAGKKFTIQVSNPKGEKIHKQQFTADEFGGFAGEYKLPNDAALGRYYINILPIKIKPEGFPKVVQISGGNSFRVEEYKKPEFEVTVDAPDKPVKLGEKITATITAKYYFGAPVTNATVKYKVTRSNYESRWYPIDRWDWLYGNGYWWFAPDYSWYRGFSKWGCMAPRPYWFPVRHDPPEIVLENEVEVGEDGTVKIEIDTAVAQAVHGDRDHQYTITAEVVDQSRRTIVGSGNVLVARKPFKVFTWVDRGHYRVGDTIRAKFKAQTLDQKPVAGTGKLTLFKIDYDADLNPIETEVESWDLNTTDEGTAAQVLTAATAGQYRLSYQLTDSEKHSIEGGYLFNVIGENFTGDEFQFNDLELITDKREYKPGDKAQVMINTNRIGSTVLLFLRPVNSVYLPPKVLRLSGKSTLFEIPITDSDYPNLFIEAITVSNGKLHTASKELVVPPADQVINVAVDASSKEYKPGEQATIKLKLTDINGEPFAGSAVLSVYDKSVEYISGGSNVPEIRAHFWKWRRRHSPQTVSNLNRYFSNLYKRGEETMQSIGVFGGMFLQVNDLMANNNGVEKKQSMRSAAFAGAADAQSAAAPARMAKSKSLSSDRKAVEGQQAGGKDKSDGQSAGANLVEPTVRSNFADTAFWAGSVTTDKNGTAEVAFSMPENLTTWKIKTWALGHGSKVGQAETEVLTTKNLIVRLQAPRFFTQKDTVVLSAVVHNYLDEAKQATIQLNLEGGTLALSADSASQTVEIPAGGETRVDWTVQAVKEGTATISMKALTDEESDAMQMTFPVYVHGMLKTESWTGIIRPSDSSGKLTVNVPEQRRPEQTRLEIRYSPTLAGALVDALPYLVNYPHKTTDTTLTRFLPTVITQNILKRLGVNLKDIKEKQTNLNAQEIGDDAERAKQWKRFKRNPVFDEDEVANMVKVGVRDLTSMQLSDGGWGWFSGYGEHSSAHTTAQVVHGLQIAQQNGIALVPNVMQRGVAWLTTYQNEQVRRLKNAPSKTKPYKTKADNLDALVFMVLTDGNVKNTDMLNFLYRDRTTLAVYAKGMLGLACAKLKENEKLAMLVRNIDQFLVEDNENQTAYLKLPGNSYWWYWYDSEVEANAYYLKLLMITNPKSEKAPRLVKYLLNNRKHSTYWNSTRDTAVAIEALADFLKASGEDKPNLTVDILVDGKKLKSVKITPENLFSFDNKLVLAGVELTSGPHTVEIKKSGTGPIYYNAYLTNFTLEDFITRAGLELKVNRKYYKLTPKEKKVNVAGSRGQVVSQKVEKYERSELVNLSSVQSGDLVEIELEIDSKNDYEYLVFEDKKAAGFEPFDVQSGYVHEGLRAYRELRDERVVFFVRRLTRGKHSVSYRMRAEIPGKFSALPTKAYAMYAPELKGNSDEIKLSISDKLEVAEK